MRQIAQNSGVDGSIVVGKVLENKSNTFGFDAQTEEYKDLVQAGIIDPAKVVRVALQDAASVAGLLVTTEAMVADMPKKEAPRRCLAAAWAEWAAWTTSPAASPGVQTGPSWPRSSERARFRQLREKGRLN